MNHVGIDIVEVGDVEYSLAEFGERFLAKFFTESERRDCAGDPRRLAARLAVKEAVIKALRPPSTAAMPARDIEVIGTDSGPELLLHGRIADRAEALAWTHTSISLTHTDRTAAAVVMASTD